MSFAQVADGNWEPALQRRRRAVVTILLPAKDEEAGLAETLDALPVARLTELGYPVEVLVADGRSSDRTEAVARSRGARIVQQLGTGKGRAVRSALDVARGAFVVMLDADATYPARAVPAFVAMLEDGYDVVMGTRLSGRIEAHAMRPVNRVGNMALSSLASLLYGRRCTDLCTGMLAFRRDAVRQLNLSSVGFEIEAELFAQSARAGLQIAEVPITYARRAGETKLGGVPDGFRIARALIHHRIR